MPKTPTIEALLTLCDESERSAEGLLLDLEKIATPTLNGTPKELRLLMAKARIRDAYRNLRGCRDWLLKAQEAEKEENAN